MKRVVIICLSVFFCLIFVLSSLAASYTAYSSVTPTTTNINNLINMMINQSDFDLFKDWIGIRTDQYDYSVFYNIDNGKAIRLRYYGIQNGYNIDYYYSKTNESNFSYNQNYYSIAGNVNNSLASSDYNNYLYQFILKISSVFIVVLFIFFIFKIKKRSNGISL